MNEGKDYDLIEPVDNNILVASWIDDWGIQQKDFDNKILFYNSESILNSNDTLHHFNKDNKNLFYDKSIEFSCKKGQQTQVNQDNFFVLVDGETKIYGVFDGHGVNGQQVSSFASGCMLEYIKNSKNFRDKNFFDSTGGHFSDAEMTKAIKQCFQYTQDRVR